MEQIQSIKKIGLVRLSAIGDTVLMVPAVHALQKRFPDAEITWIIGRGAYSLLEGLPGVRFLVVDKPKSWRQYRACLRQLRAESFDVLLAAQASLSANLLYPLIKAPIKIGFDRKRARDGQGLFVNRRIEAKREHLLDAFMQFAKTLGASATAPKWDLPISAEDREWVQKTLDLSRPWIAVNVAASKAERNWALENYASVLEQAVQRYQLNVVLVGGSQAVEVQRAVELESLLKVPVTNLVGKTSLKQLAALLGEAKVLLSPDSGPVHIATAMGTPVLGLYAVASAQLSGPYLSRQWVVDKYPLALQKFLHKDFANVEWNKKRVHHPEAMSLITVDEVLQKLEQLTAEKNAQEPK